MNWRRLARPRSLVVASMITFVVIVLAVVLPIAYTYLRAVEQLLTDTLAAQVAVVAQRGVAMIDAAQVATFHEPERADSPEYEALQLTLARIQIDYDVDNAVVYRRIHDGSYVYVADGSDNFAMNEHVDLHDQFPETKPPADEAWETGKLGRTGLFRSQDTKWFQVNAPLEHNGKVVALLLINKFATPVAEDIRRRQRAIVLGVGGVLAGSIVLWGFLTVRVLRPLVDLRRAAVQISGGSLDVTLPPYRARNEVGELTAAFSQMVTDLKASRSQVEEFTQLLQHEKASFFRFVPTQFLDLLGRQSAVEIQVGDHSPRSMSVLFSDIRSFTTFAETLEAQEVFGFLNEYLARMEPAIQRHRGFVDKFMGDGIMALFADHEVQRLMAPDLALNAAVDMRRELADYNRHRERQGRSSIRIGVGIHSGMLVLGTVGSPQRLNTTVVGDTVNLASRIEGLTAHYRAGLIVSGSVVAGLADRDSRRLREIAAVRVKGKAQAVTLFEVFDWEDDDARRRKVDSLAEFSDALVLYRAGRFGEAGGRFGQLMASVPGDRVSQYYHEQCGVYSAQPPQAPWEGIDVFLSK
jgi:class 3 adenylate cyclase